MLSWLVESIILDAIFNGQLVYLTPLSTEHEILPTTQIKPTNLINCIVAVAQINPNPSYNIGFMNCTDLAIMIFESQTSVNIPNCESPYPWNGQTPGTFGQVLNSMPVPTGGTRNSNGGSAPNNNCN